MEKVVYSGTAGIALLLIIGSYLLQNSLIMWLASDSITMNMARLLLVAAMGCMLFLPMTYASQQQRKLLSAVAIGCAAWAFLSIFNGSSNVLDAVLFALAGCAFGLVAVKSQPDFAHTELKLADFDDNLTFEPVYGLRSVFWRSFRPELVGYGWAVLAAAASGKNIFNTDTASAKTAEPKLALAPNST